MGLPAMLRRVAFDVFHAPAYIAPLHGVYPLVLTIHDVSYARHPEWYPYRIDPLRRWFHRRSAKVADWIVTDSEFSRREILAAYDLRPERVVVVPLGVASTFTPAPAAPPAEDLAAFGLTVPFLLHVGDLHPRRNLGTAVAAVYELRRRSELASLQLALAGTDRGVGEDLRRLARQAGQPDAVAFLGTPPDEQLLLLYRSAAALVYPSRYEGFGLPILEAMACGLPVVAARAGSIPEVAGTAALLVDPDDVRGFAGAIASVLLDAERRGEVQRASLARSRDFTWTRTARATLAVYRNAAERHVERKDGAV